MAREMTTKAQEAIASALQAASAAGNPQVEPIHLLQALIEQREGIALSLLEAVGADNAYIFGATDDELPELRRHYDPRWHYENVPGLKRVIDALTDGTLNDNNSGWFYDIRHSILEGGYDPADVYYVLGDFASYRETKDRMAADYRDQKAWNARVWANISRSGRFSSDRTISDYAREVWHIEGEPIA